MKTIIWGWDTSELRLDVSKNSSSSWKLVLKLNSLNHTIRCIMSYAPPKKGGNNPPHPQQNKHTHLFPEKKLS